MRYKQPQMLVGVLLVVLVEVDDKGLRELLHRLSLLDKVVVLVVEVVVAGI
jgi:hypothetical protein